MIQFVLPPIFLASACSNSDTKESATDPLKAQPLKMDRGIQFANDYLKRLEDAQSGIPTKTYKLKNFIVHDQNSDGYLDPEDSVFRRLTSAFGSTSSKYSKIEQDSPEFRGLLEKLGHRDGSRFWLEGAYHYLNIHDRKPSSAGGGIYFDDHSTLDLATRDMNDFAIAEEFAQMSALEFNGSVFLSGVQADLEGEFGRCLKSLDGDIEYFIPSGHPVSVHTLKECRGIADMLDLSFSEYRKDELNAIEERAKSLGVPIKDPLKNPQRGSIDW